MQAGHDHFLAPLVNFVVVPEKLKPPSAVDDEDVVVGGVANDVIGDFALKVYKLQCASKLNVHTG